MPRTAKPRSSDERTLLQALEYARDGWPVLPVRKRSREPLTPPGVKDATTDADTIRQWSPIADCPEWLLSRLTTSSTPAGRSDEERHCKLSERVPSGQRQEKGHDA